MTIERGWPLESDRGAGTAAARRNLEAEAEFAAFFRRLGSAPGSALLLDFDGVLAPFLVDRSALRMYRGVRAALAALTVAPQRCRVGIVSGRPITDLRRLIRLDGVVELWGSHGLERFSTDGWWSGPPPSRAASKFMQEMVQAAGDAWSGILERRPYGLALHWKGRPAGFAEQLKKDVRRLWAAPARAAGLEVRAFETGLEFRPAGIHKGRVIDRLFAELGEDAAIAYLGDDRTDEDAFRTLRKRGLTALVSPTPRTSLATVWLRPPEDLLSFLGVWARTCSDAGIN